VSSVRSALPAGVPPPPVLEVETPEGRTIRAKEAEHAEGRLHARPGPRTLVPGPWVHIISTCFPSLVLTGTPTGIPRSIREVYPLPKTEGHLPRPGARGALLCEPALLLGRSIFD